MFSKILIVEDAVAIIGSANINDRSLNGNGDTGLAAVVVDNQNAKMTDVGQGVKIIVRKFARDLRIDLWKKHLGILVDEETTGAQKENLPVGIDLLHPLSEATIRSIKDLGKANRKAYDEVFIHTPRDSSKTLTEGRRAAYPILSAKDDSRDFSRAPHLRPNYMQKDAHLVEKSINFLRKNVHGFWVEMPLEWGDVQLSTPAAPHKLSQAIAQNSKLQMEMEAT